MTTLVVGDVHGCADELATLVRDTAPDRVVLVGDLFTKGPDPVGVWRQIDGWEAALGNHDARLLDCLEGERPDDAHGHAVCAKLDAADRWGWRAWLRARPLTVSVGRFTVVHAALPDDGRPSRKTALLQRRRPGQPRGARWWQAYAGKPVIFGHDAVRGLVRVEEGGEPVVIGLDSGCVYGGHLSGYVVEEDRVVSVRARRVYRRPG
jgi:hypothetical protein